MAAWVDPTGSWKQIDMDQQLLRREMKVASGMMWNQDASKMRQDGIYKMWRLAGLGLGGNEGAKDHGLVWQWDEPDHCSVNHVLFFSSCKNLHDDGLI